MLFKDVEAGQVFRQDGTVWLKIIGDHVDNDYNAVILCTAEPELKAYVNELDWCPENLRVDAIYELSYE